MFTKYTKSEAPENASTEFRIQNSEVRIEEEKVKKVEKIERG